MKRVGIDFRALQIGHQFRGIGEVVRRVSYELAQILNEDDEIVVFQYEDNREVAKGVSTKRLFCRTHHRASWLKFRIVP